MPRQIDSIINRYDSEKLKDLHICEHRGVAYQPIEKTFDYGPDYFANYKQREGTSIANAINDARISLVMQYYGTGKMLDVGIGSGEFIKRRSEKQNDYLGAKTFGYDINPVGKSWLEKFNIFSDRIEEFDAVSFWDVLEHVEKPEIYLNKIKKGAFVFASIPTFPVLREVFKSKHYKPGEHIYYFTPDGFEDYMKSWGFRLIRRDDRETLAGRESITSYVFKKDLPDFRDMIGAYQAIHDSRHYGDSAHLYLSDIARIVIPEDPGTILDYGCGRSDLSAHFWKDGKRRIEKYDPAINRYKMMPEGGFDLVICCDVMEHIPVRFVPRIFEEIKRKSMKVIFTISTIPSRAKLPDGTNAHVTLLKRSEWLRWIKETFGFSEECESSLPNSMVVRTW